MTTAPAIAAQPKGKAWHSLSNEEVPAQLGSVATGLSAPEAARRLAQNGPNELKEGNANSSRSPIASCCWPWVHSRW